MVWRMTRRVKGRESSNLAIGVVQPRDNESMYQGGGWNIEKALI